MFSFRLMVNLLVPTLAPEVSECWIQKLAQKFGVFCGMNLIFRNLILHSLQKVEWFFLPLRVCACAPKCAQLPLWLGLDPVLSIFDELLYL